MKLTLVPGQIEVALAAMLIVGNTLALIVTVKLFELAVDVPEHVPLAVKVQVTTSAFAKLVEVNVAVVAPLTGEPFTFH